MQKRFFFGVIGAILVFIIIILLNLSPILAVVLGVAFFFLVYMGYLIRLKNALRKSCIELERLIPVLRLEIKFLLKIVDKEHDIQKVFLEILQDLTVGRFQQIIKQLSYKVVLGNPVEKMLMNFDSPSKKLNEFMFECSDPRALPFMGKEIEPFMEYKVFIKTIESRLVILIAEGIFLPILASMIFIFQRLDLGLHIFLVIIHFIILKYASKILLDKQFSLLYMSESFLGSHKDVIDPFISFLFVLGKNLKDHAPEKALILTIIQATREISVFTNQETWKNALMLNFFQKMQEITTETKSSIIRLVSSVIFKSKAFLGKDLGGLILDIAVELKREREIAAEKHNIINAERFKVKILVICLSVILSIITALFPYMIFGGEGSISGLITPNSGDVSFKMLVFILLNVSYNYISCFYLVKITGIHQSHGYAILATCLFLFILLVGLVFYPTPL
jgi:hypothetical protein